MATVTFNPLVAVDFTILNTTRSSVDITTPTSYDFDSSNADIDMEGAGLVFDGSDNVTGGTITQIDIDINSDQGAVNGGDINIDGLNIAATADLGAVDNGAFSLFGIALQGNDTFLLGGLNEDLDTPTATNRVFGDDLANLILFTIGGTNTNTGGRDVFSGADNRLEVSGDVWNLNTAAFALGSTYNGGNDSYFGLITEELNRVAGDAWTIDRTGPGQMTLNGGDDMIDLGGNTSSTSWIAGDVNDMNNGVVNGGNDQLTSDDSSSPEVSGDVRNYNGGTLNGGDDIISLANFGRAGGDVMFLNAPIPAGVFTLTGGNDEIHGGAQDDIIGGEVHDRNSTVDNLIVGGDDIIDGGAGDDDLFGEIAFGNAATGVSGGDDVISGGAGNDELRGQTGDDLLDGGAGNDVIDGGDGDDTVSYATSSAGVTVNLLLVGAQNTVGAGSDSLIALEHLTGSRYADTLRGNNASNVIGGGNGDDRLIAGAGEDALNGGSGDDILNTVGQTDDTAIGGSGNDTFQADGGGNVLIGNAGLDTVNFSTVAAASTIDLVAGLARQNAGATVDTLFFVENAGGGGGNDTIVGSVAANVLTGRNGDDNISGGDGNDTIDGGNNADTLLGEAGNDEIVGGAGNDQMNGGAGNDTMSGGDDVDTMIGGDNNDVLNGDAGNDVLSGGRQDDTLNGGTGSDTLNGGEDVDTLNGSTGNDTLNGGIGNDVMDGGVGNDTYNGGDGADTMIFTPDAGSPLDVVANFEDTGSIADDLIDVTAYNFVSVASITASASGNDVILNFGGGDRVRLEGYLLTNTLANIDAGDFLL